VKASARSLLPRFVALLVFWLILEGVNPAGLLIGVPAAVLATWLARLLIPPGGCISPVRSLAFCAHFLWSSLLAGIDVAIRALHPRLPLRTGFVSCPCGISRGWRRELFLTASSLMPGSLPVAEEADGQVILHALDVNQPHARQMEENEAGFARALGDRRLDA
jgi:multicomponent Na+:H+ antiporter subunit E